MTRNTDRPTLSLALALALCIALALLLAKSAPAESTDDLVFTTADQSIWGPRQGVDEKTFEVDIIDIRESGSEGEIRRVTVDVDNSKAQAAWEKAIDTCDKKSYSRCVKKILGKCVKTVTFSPTRNQCRDGYTPPGRKRIKGIGPKPAATRKETFDVGAELRWNQVLNAGVGGRLAVDEGSVDVTANLRATLRASSDAVAPGQVFTLHTAQTTGDVDMQTSWPNVDMSISAFLQADAEVVAEAAGPDTRNGTQRRETEVILDVGTNGRDTLELVGLNVGTSGIEFRALGSSTKLVEDGYEHNQSIELLNLPPYIAVGLPLFDIGVFTPEMETPVIDPDSFEGYFVNGSYSSFDGYSGSIYNIVEPGDRTTQIVTFGEATDGLKDPDVARLDLDVDVLSAKFGSPLGFDASVGEISYVGNLLEVEGNALDVDLTMYFGFEETFTFEPNLRVRLQFNQPVEVEVEEGVWQVVSEIEVPVGDSVNVVHPDSELVVTPVYTLAENRFHNDTDFVVDPAYTWEVLSVHLGGLIFDYGAPGLPESFAAASRTAPFTGESLKLVDMNYLDETCQDEDCAAVFPLNGFEDRVGTPLVVGTADALDSDGDLVADHEDNCLDEPNTSQLDTDRDGYGNACDADINNDGRIGGPDFIAYTSAYGAVEGDERYDPALDMDGDGVIGGPEIIMSQGFYGKEPGPSGLACAGTVPCPKVAAQSKHPKPVPAQPKP